MDGADPPRFPQKYLSAAALIRHRGRVLLVNPTYKPQWEIPGGIVEDGESPRTACLRELCEELGLDWPVGRLLGVDYRANPRFGEAIHFIFDGGETEEATLASIQLQDAELSEWRLVTREEVETLATPALAKRVLACLEAAEAGTTLYMEDGVPR